MTYLTVDDIKKHLNIDAEFLDDDQYLRSLGDVAEQIIAQHLEDKLDDIAEDNGGTLPAPILHACLLLIGNLYMSRESVTFSSVSEIPMSFGENIYQYLLSPYINYKQSGR